VSLQVRLFKVVKAIIIMQQARYQIPQPQIGDLTANPSYQKTVIFPKSKEAQVYSSDESVRGWSLREANVHVSTKGAPHDGKDTERTLQTII